MNEIVILIISMIMMPILYFGGLMLSKSSFSEEENINRKPFHSIWEILTLTVSELLIIKLWYSNIYKTESKLYFAMLFIALALITTICITDIWEHIVSNRLLLIGLCLGLLIIGIYFLADMKTAVGFLTGAAIGFVFCLLCFGMVYLATKGGLGAGDVKLCVLLGLIMTDKFVVKTLLYACIVSALYSIFMLIRKKLDRHSSFPFVPFIYIGMAITIILG